MMDWSTCTVSSKVDISKMTGFNELFPINNLIANFVSNKLVYIQKSRRRLRYEVTSKKLQHDFCYALERMYSNFHGRYLGNYWI